MGPKTLLGAYVNLVPALGFTFAAIILETLSSCFKPGKQKVFILHLSFFFFLFLD